MRNTPVQKLRSERGASLSMALLLFLVCVTVSSVVIAAASAAAGRQAQLKETDRSYYNVTSAVGLFWDEMQPDVSVDVTRWQDSTTGDWNFKIDALGDNVAPTPARATYFQIATYELLGLSDVGATMQGTPPMPREVTRFSALDGNAFVVTSTDHQDIFPQVKVGVAAKDEDGGIVTFAFEEQDGPKSSCTLTASVAVSPPRDANGTLVTTVTWNALYVNMGAA